MDCVRRLRDPSEMIEWPGLKMIPIEDSFDRFNDIDLNSRQICAHPTMSVSMLGRLLEIKREM